MPPPTLNYEEPLTGPADPRASIWLLHHHMTATHMLGSQSDLERRYE